MNRILITGITGFTGSHLTEKLIDDNDIYGTVRGRCRQTNFIDHLKCRLSLLECDLTDYNSIQSTIDEAQPDIIYHLGAQSFVPTSWRAPQETMNTNVLGTLNLLESIRKSKCDPTTLIAGSSEEYGMVKEHEIPIRETNELRPLSPYAVSKVAQDLLGYQYFKSYGLNIVRTRCFNIIGPRSGGKIVTAALAKKFWNTDIVKVGNTDAIRDYVDVRDVANAYTLAVDKCNHGEAYNISTGIGHSVSEIIDTYLELIQKVSKGRPIEIRRDESLMRPSDVPVLIGDSTKFRNKTGWKPIYEWEKSLEDVFNYWRGK